MKVVSEQKSIGKQTNEQRGSRLHKAILFDEPIIDKAVNSYNGRNPKLVNLRNKLIATRYYFYTRMIRMNYPDTYNVLEDEFFLSQIQLVRIVANYTDELLALKKKPPTVKQLAVDYPFFVWVLKQYAK